MSLFLDLLLKGLFSTYILALVIVFSLFFELSKLLKNYSEKPNFDLGIDLRDRSCKFSLIFKFFVDVAGFYEMTQRDLWLHFFRTTLEILQDFTHMAQKFDVEITQI
jgi:hypothetical protein